jgi:dephospho-CoA kinase
MTFVIGLTGSIGMGKSTTAAMFRDAGIPVWDADAIVHALYAPDGAATKAVADLFPKAIVDGAVSRPALRALIADDPTVMDRLQAVVHPLVAADRMRFLESTESDIVLLDIPLLFETGADQFCDMTVVVSVPEETQKARVLARGEMTEAEFEMIKSRQMPDAEKRKRADHLIETRTLDQTRMDVQKLLGAIRGKLANA